MSGNTEFKLSLSDDGKVVIQVDRPLTSAERVKLANDLKRLSTALRWASVAPYSIEDGVNNSPA